MLRTRVGYAGGTTENPTYRNIGDHTETIQLDYDPLKISYRDLLDIFWENHSPEYEMSLNQYMSIIFYHNEEQKKLAIETKSLLEENIGSRIYTQIKPESNLYLAENYHQKYYLRRVRELMNEFEKVYPNYRAFINSTITAKINGYIKGYGTVKMLEEDINKFGLSAKGQKRLFQIVEGYGR